VELLVVIGIIALLISILLPGLNRAREQANLVGCESDLRQIGGMIAIYEAEHNGFLPYGHAVAGSKSNPLTVTNYYNLEGISLPMWDWPDSLTKQSNSKAPGDGGTPVWDPFGYGFQIQNEQNMAIDFNPVFHDYDTLPVPYTARVSDFFANPRILANNVFPDMPGSPSGTSDNAYTSYLPIRQVGSIKRSSETAMVWCGPQNLAFTGGNSVTAFWPDGPNATQIEWSAIDWGSGGAQHYLCYPLPPGSTYPENTVKGGYFSPIGLNNMPGIDYQYCSTTGGATKKSEAAQNLDNTDVNYNIGCNMRFRHMQNTVTNLLFVDGHVESRALGQVLAKDICVNFTSPSAQAPGN
jgi:prepilin-type processing-associated H-X9-DG protein